MTPRCVRTVSDLCRYGSRFVAASVAVSLGDMTKSYELKDEAVADTPDRDDFVAERAEFLAQPGDMRIYRSLEAVVLIAPDTLDQKLAAKRATGMLDEELKQLEFLGGKI